MDRQPSRVDRQKVVDRGDFERLIERVRALGYETVGPAVADGSIVYDEIRTTDDLPIGWVDEQEKGTYRLTKGSEKSLFGFTVGPHSWKKYLFPPTISLWKARQDGDGIQIISEAPAPRKLAFLGVRPCDLHAIFVQDRVFMGGSAVDPTYAATRKSALIITVNCGRAGGTCFCVSMGTGPRARSGFDLSLTEVLTDDRHYFVVEIGSEAGVEVLEGVPRRDATDEELAQAARVTERAEADMGRELDTQGLKELLYDNYEHPRWADVASRCLSCANCTMVCPTCFCSTVEDTTDLSGDETERARRWDSCFTADFSYIHGGSVRVSPRSRYRQWMTHKLGTWLDQFGTSGCVGCGRCITWCPVGIDITEEAAAIRATDGASPRAREDGTDGES